MKKLLALVLALVLVLGMGVTAFAAEGKNDDSGSITINNAHIGTTYSIYQILVLESYNTDSNAYSYKPHEDWEAFVKNSQYLKTNKDGYIEWNGTPTQAAAAAFAQEALAYAKNEENNIKPIAFATATADNEGNAEDVVFEKLNLGYWLVDSSLGALCSLDTVMPKTVIEEKNPPVLVDKKVQDNAGIMQEAISSRIGKVETFMSRITLYAGSENVVYHDVMQDTIDYIEGSVEVYLTPVSAGKKLTAETDYVVNEACTAHEDPNSTADPKENVKCTFEVTFTEAFLKTITEATNVTVVYKGALKASAIIAGEGNINDAMVTFGDDGFTTWDDAKLYTYQFGIVKTDISNHILEGAEFDLYYSKTGNDQIALVEENPTYEGFNPVSGVKYYRPATDIEKAGEGFVSAKIVAGKACIWGVRDGVAMYLEETKAPEGYNKLTERAHITALQSANNVPEFDTNGLYVRGGVEVENLAGAQLPQTGGIGTTLFYVLGGIMAAAAVVVLVTKRRMSTEE